MTIGYEPSWFVPNKVFNLKKPYSCSENQLRLLSNSKHFLCSSRNGFHLVLLGQQTPKLIPKTAYALSKNVSSDIPPCSASARLCPLVCWIAWGRGLRLRLRLILVSGSLNMAAYAAWPCNLKVLAPAITFVPGVGRFKTVQNVATTGTRHECDRPGVYIQLARSGTGQDVIGGA